MREAIKFSENSVLPELDFELNYGKMLFVIFTRKKHVFGKTNYSLLSFPLGPTYEQNMSEIDFSTCATESRFVWVIAWGRVKLRINITRVFRNCRNCPSRAATRAISAISDNTSDIYP